MLLSFSHAFLMSSLNHGTCVNLCFIDRQTFCTTVMVVMLSSWSGEGMVKGPQLSNMAQWEQVWPSLEARLTKKPVKMGVCLLYCFRSLWMVWIIPRTHGSHKLPPKYQFIPLLFIIISTLLFIIYSTQAKETGAKTSVPQVCCVSLLLTFCSISCKIRFQKNS